MKLKGNQNATILACCMSSLSQAASVNLAPLLFVTFQKQFSVSLTQLTLLVTLNFLTQLLVDLASSKFADKIGLRKCIFAGNFFSAVGLLLLGVLPSVMMNPYLGLIIAVEFYAIGGGLIEVLASPILEAAAEKKSGFLAFLHFIYCFGCVVTVLFSTLYFVLFGVENWNFLPIIWSILPFVTACMFIFVPIKSLTEKSGAIGARKLFKSKLFWLFLVLMLCSGASEQAVVQWCSLFAEEGLKVTKSIGDLFGFCLFVSLMGVARIIYSRCERKIDKPKALQLSCAICFSGYLLIIVSPTPVIGIIGCALSGFGCGIFWPCVLKIASDYFEQGGVTLFAFLAMAGDIGCFMGPSVVGYVSDIALNTTGGGWITNILSSGFIQENYLKFGFLAAAVFPLALLIAINALERAKKNKLVKIGEKS